MGDELAIAVGGGSDRARRELGGERVYVQRMNKGELTDTV